MSEQNDILKLIGKLQFIRDYECKTEDEVKAMCETIRILSELPPAQPQRIHGKWTKGIGENGVTTSLFCDQCRYENRHWYEWNFCPNCGDDKREESKDDKS